MSASLDGLTIAITGASAGIGRALALACVASGADVWACARSADALAQLRQESAAPERLHVMSVDVRERAQVAAWAHAITSGAGGLDVAVLNASILGPTGPLATLDPQGWKDTFDVNVHGVFHCAQLLWPLLVARAPNSLMLNVTSSVGRVARADWGSYCASKHALEAITGICAQEGAALGVKAASINPGGTATAMRAQAYPAEDPATLPTAETIAATFLAIIADRATLTSGAQLNSRDLL